MSDYFIDPIEQEVYPGVLSKHYFIGDLHNTVIIISRILPGVVVPKHAHLENQIGMCLEGEYTIAIGNDEFILKGMGQMYWLPSKTNHSAYNNSDKVAVTLDIKRLPSDEDLQLTKTEMSNYILHREGFKRLKGGLELEFYVGPWFEIMYSKLEPGATMPKHSHRGIQIGLGLTGSYLMDVNGVKERFSRDSVYFADENVLHSAINDTLSDATSLNIFIPPRWNLLPITERPIRL